MVAGLRPGQWLPLLLLALPLTGWWALCLWSCASAALREDADAAPAESGLDELSWLVLLLLTGWFGALVYTLTRLRPRWR